MRHKGEQTGSVRKRNGNYTVRFYSWQTRNGELQYVLTERVVGPISNYASQKAAELDAYARFVLPANNTKAAAHGVFTVRDFYTQRFLTDAMQDYSLNWSRSAKSIFEVHILPRFGALGLADVRPLDVQDFINAKAKEFQPQTVKHIHRLLFQLFRHARRLHILEGVNPAEDLILPKMQFKAKHALTMDQVLQLVGKLPEQYGRVVLVLTHTGMRIGECLGLRWRSVDFNERVIHVVEQQTGGEQKGELKTQTGRRIIPMTATAERALKEELAGSQWTGEDQFVFAARNGQALNANNIRKRFLSPTAEGLNLGLVTWHTFRHTTASLLDRYTTASEKAKVLGHTSEAMGLRYTHAELDAIRKAMDSGLEARMVQ